ncbi:hypothetical protein FKX85_10940 [Echinicola soli]|uniref:Uncharacterized protein n=1 Tax=Echinicola soli TaxID=2591634 RepID=A0A514CIB3_9BACT|nr:hypothetical protein [Echinicola soli]QDH79526.1 hypothetical protein FKX85_10940 [Echinicola soli]
MKTLRKSTCTLLSVIGILSSQLLSSCGREMVDGVHYEEYYFVNESDYEITIDAFYELYEAEDVHQTFSLPKGGNVVQEIELFFGSDPVIAYSDSVSVVFDGIREAGFSHLNIDSPFNLLNPANSTFEEIAHNRDRYTYVFTNEDYENAVPIDKD